MSTTERLKVVRHFDVQQGLTLGTPAIRKAPLIDPDARPFLGAFFERPPELITFETTSRRPHGNRVGGDVATAPRDTKTMRSSAVSVGATERAASEQDSKDPAGTALVTLVRHRLEHHPHFRGRSSLFTIQRVGPRMVISGSVPSYYLQQLLQEAIKGVPGVSLIENRVQVTWPTLSGRQPEHAR